MRKIVGEINEVENKRLIEKINKKFCFLERSIKLVYF